MLSRRHSPNSMPQCVYGHALATMHEGPVEQVHLISVCLMPLLDLFLRVERNKPSNKVSYEAKKKPLCTVIMLMIDLLSAVISKRVRSIYYSAIFCEILS